MPRSSCQWTLVQFTAATQTGCGGSGPKHKKAVKFKRHEGKRWEKSRINIKTMRPLNWIGYPWPMFEAHIFLQNTAAQHSSEYLLADNNNTSALQHRWTQSLIPCRCNLQPVGLIYFLLLSSAGSSSDKFFIANYLEDHMFEGGRVGGNTKTQNNALYLGVVVMLIIPSVNRFAQCQNMRSVVEFIQNLASRRRQEVSDWKVCEDGFCSPWLSW